VWKRLFDIAHRATFRSSAANGLDRRKNVAAFCPPPLNGATLEKSFSKAQYVAENKKNYPFRAHWSAGAFFLRVPR
jgi:hypothetical protein